MVRGLADGIFWGGVFAFVSASVNAIKTIVRGKELLSFELDPRSIEQAKQGNPSWNTFRKRIWQNEAKYRPEVYGDQVKNMSKGLAPKVNGKAMQLHHVVGKANDMYNVVKLTQNEHILFHQTFGYSYNSSWTIQNLIKLFG